MEKLEVFDKKFLEALSDLEKQITKLYPTYQAKYYDEIYSISNDIIFFAKEILKHKTLIKSLKLIKEDDVERWNIGRNEKDKWKKLIIQYGPIYFDDQVARNLRYAIENYSYRVASFQDEIAKKIDIEAGFLLMDPSFRGQKVPPTAFLRKYKESLRRYLYKELNEIFTSLDNETGIKAVINLRHQFAHQQRLKISVLHQEGKRKLKINDNIFHEVDAEDFFNKILNSLTGIIKILFLITEMQKTKKVNEDYLNALKAKFKFDFEKKLKNSEKKRRRK